MNHLAGRPVGPRAAPPCKNTVVALECSEVLRVDRQAFQEVLQMNHLADRNSKAGSNDRRGAESMHSRANTTTRTSPTVVSSGRAASTWEDEDADSFGGDL